MIKTEQNKSIMENAYNSFMAGNEMPPELESTVNKLMCECIRGVEQELLSE